MSFKDEEWLRCQTEGQGVLGLFMEKELDHRMGQGRVGERTSIRDKTKYHNIIIVAIELAYKRLLNKPYENEVTLTG